VTAQVNLHDLSDTPVRRSIAPSRPAIDGGENDLPRTSERAAGEAGEGLLEGRPRHVPRSEGSFSSSLAHEPEALNLFLEALVDRPLELEPRILRPRHSVSPPCRSRGAR
jgi:hypothetical protein